MFFMKILTLSEHSRRIKNINEAEKGNRSYFCRHRIRDYLPGQTTYNLGDYPASFSISPTDYDYEMLKSLSENGVELIQVHEEWNDSLRHLGATKHTSHDPEGMKKFVDLCHNFGIKVIPYASTGYISQYDPDFREEFTRGKFDLVISHFHYRMCYAGSGEWREYLLPKLQNILDTYGFDGLYNDLGYDENEIFEKKMFSEGKNPYELITYNYPYDPEIEDFLSLIYSEVKSRGGVYKIHVGRNNTVNVKDKVYDYLWIGENASSEGIGVGKDFPQYIVPCEHSEFSSEKNPDFFYARTIPFMQFPLLKRGRPLRGAGLSEDIKYNTTDGEHLFKLRVRDWAEKHPDGPHVYSLWSSIPDDTEEYARFCRYLALYKPMVEENSLAYIELRECDEILSSIPQRVIASMFVNEEKYLVVSNLSEEDYTLDLKEAWEDRVTKERKNSFVIKPKEILFLIK